MYLKFPLCIQQFGLKFGQIKVSAILYHLNNYVPVLLGAKRLPAFPPLHDGGEPRLFVVLSLLVHHLNVGETDQLVVVFRHCALKMNRKPVEPIIKVIDS